MVLPLVLLLIVILCVALLAVVGKKKQRTAVTKSSSPDHGAAFHLEDSSEPERASTFFEKILPPVLTLLLSVSWDRKLLWGWSGPY